MQFYPRCRISG